MCVHVCLWYVCSPHTWCVHVYVTEARVRAHYVSRTFWWNSDTQMYTYCPKVCMRHDVHAVRVCRCVECVHVLLCLSMRSVCVKDRSYCHQPVPSAPAPCQFLGLTSALSSPPPTASRVPLAEGPAPGPCAGDFLPPVDHPRSPCQEAAAIKRMPASPSPGGLPRSTCLGPDLCSGVSPQPRPGPNLGPEREAWSAGAV